MKFKKSMLTLATATGIIAPVATVVSCGNGGGDKVGFVQLITDGAPIEDKSFNEQARDAAKSWADTNSKTWGALQSRGSSVAQIKQAFQSAVDAGSKALIMTGYGFGQSTTKEFASSHSNIKFVHVDEDVVGQNNVASLTYATEGAAYLAGIATGIMLNLNFDRFSSNGLKVGAWGGQDIDPIWRFIGGWQQGIDYFNRNIAKDADHQISFVIPGNDRDSMISGNWNTGGGTTIATHLLGKYADIIMGVAGIQSNDGVQVIKSSTGVKSKALVIGVDTDQTRSLGTDGKYAFTSIEKNVYSTVKRALDVLLNNKQDDKIVAGQKNFHGLAEHFVKISNGLIKGTGKVDAGKSGQIQVSTSSTDRYKLESLFKIDAIDSWSLTDVQKSIYDIANLDAYRTAAENAEPLMWSGFTGGNQIWDSAAAKNDTPSASN